MKHVEIFQTVGVLIALAALTAGLLILRHKLYRYNG
jgi:hypothetical protein